MILSKREKGLIEMLELVDGPMPIDWIKPHYKSAVPRLRALGLIYKRPSDWLRLTTLGHTTALTRGTNTDLSD